MTKKKKRQNPEIDELLARPWCYYCERDFDDLKILIHHQKAKHFKCDRCARRLNTAGGLRVHMEQVHKETLEQVENALPGRESIDLEIFGTEGIPEADVAAHNQRIMAEYAQKEADRRAASGQSNGPKKPKLDISKELDPEEIKRKLEAHKKAMASGGALPVTPVPSSMSPGGSQSPGGFDSHGSPQPQATSPPPFQPGQFAIPQPTAFSPVSGNSFTPTTYAPQPPNTYPTAPYSQPTYPQQPPAPFGRGGPQQPFSGYPQPPGGYAAPTFNGHNQFQQSAPAHLQPPRHPVPSLPLPHQIPGLPPKPSAPGLPPRPSFTNPPGGFGRGSMPGPPPGQWSPPVQQPMFNPVGSTPYGAPTQPAQPPQFLAGYAPSQHPPQQGYGAPQPSLTPANATPLGLQQVPALPDNLSKSQGPDPTQPPQEAAVEKEEPPTTAKQKRETKLLYGDNDVSPEEKRSTLSKYHFESSQVRIQV